MRVAYAAYLRDDSVESGALQQENAVSSIFDEFGYTTITGPQIDASDEVGHSRSII